MDSTAEIRRSPKGGVCKNKILCGARQLRALQAKKEGKK